MFKSFYCVSRTAKHWISPWQANLIQLPERNDANSGFRQTTIDSGSANYRQTLPHGQLLLLVPNQFNQSIKSSQENMMHTIRNQM
jgi:hypothetical protein